MSANVVDGIGTAQTRLRQYDCSEMIVALLVMF